MEVTADGILQVKGRHPSGQETGETLFEHHLQGLSRFARLHQDPRCFAYLTRTQMGGDFICHVYLATSENTVSNKNTLQIFGLHGECHECLVMLAK